jgi:signal transduction histidine kinase/ligand-binding sensor domain-containing protein
VRVPLVAAILLCLPPLSAADRQPLITRVWQSEDGLPGNVVRSIVQAADGYLWIATAEGITRFDGVEFEPVEPDGELRGIRFAFRRLFAPADGSVWVATFQGGLFRINGQRLWQVLEAPLVRPPPVSQLVTDPSGVIHFLQGERIWRVRDDVARPVEEPPAALRRLFADDFRKQQSGGRSVVAETAPSLLDRDGQLWTSDDQGRLTVADPDGGTTPVQLPEISAYNFNELLEDREGNVWVATRLGGLARVRRGRVDVLSTADGLAERTVYALTQDSTGAWWIANRRGGLDRLTEQGVQHLELVPAGYHRPAATMFEDRERRLWVASRGGSVFLHRDGAFEPQFSRSQVPSKVRSIEQDGSGRIWFGGDQGLASFDGTEVRQHDLKGGSVSVLARGPGDTLVAGTSDGRIFLGKNGGFELLGDPAPLRHHWISGILPVAADELWVATLGGGLFLWNGRSWLRFDADDGLPDLRLTCILDDGRGYLWFGSLGGILRARRDELLARATDRDTPAHWLRFDRSDGLPTRECMGGYHPAGWKGNDGRLWFPTGNGVVRLRPDLVEVNRVPPPVHLKGIRVDGRQHDAPGGLVDAGPGRTRLEFRFVGLSYSAPEKVAYRARLEGLDDTWRELGNQRVAAYEAVPPGRFTFEVVAVNGDGVWSREPARVSVHVRPHFWESAGFIVALTALTLASAAAGGWAIARSRMKRRIQLMKVRHAREAERSRIARDLHDDLGASLTEISILSALAAEAGDESTLRPSLDQLSRKAHDVVGTLDEIVWAVNPREDTLRSLVDYLAAFAREFLDTAGIPLRTDIPRQVPDLPLDTTARHGIFLAAREALNNLVKHSRATEARLAVRVARDSLEIRIEDNGRGFSQEWEAKGYGVANLRERMHACGGDCSIGSVSGHGVTVTLTLPLLADPSMPALT